MRNTRWYLAFIFGILVLGGSWFRVHAQSVYVAVDAASLSFASAHTWATLWHHGSYVQHNRLQRPAVTVQGDGEAFLTTSYEQGQERVWLVLKLSRPREVRGFLMVPLSRGGNGMRRYRFVLSEALARQHASRQARVMFYQAKVAYYRTLLSLYLPGTSWFRWQMEKAQQSAQQSAQLSTPTSQPLPKRPRIRFRGDFSHTLAFFSGGLAVSENLSLDTLLPDPRGSSSTVPIAQIRGIQTTPFDFSPHLKKQVIGVDLLSRFLPEDQYALFFPSLSGMIQNSHALASYLSRILPSDLLRGVYRTWQGFYQTQLCLHTQMLSNLVAKHPMGAVAVTGSDPYFSTGTDVAVLFHTTQPEPLLHKLQSCHTRALRTIPQARRVQGMLGSMRYSGVVSTDRRLSSYVLQLGQVLIVANSLVPIHRTVRVFLRQEKALVQCKEYLFFRRRYPLGYVGEAALLILTDTTIRRWGSPQWRIATSRRHRVAAILAALQARHLDQQPMPLHKIPWQVPGSGAWSYVGTQYRSAIYGSLSFMTPISELDLTTVTQEEAGLYRLWQQEYERQWKGTFDPIALRFVRQKLRWDIDLSVIPLIGNTAYQTWVGLFRGPQLQPQDGDPARLHLAHITVSLSPHSPLWRWADHWSEAYAHQKFSSWVGRFLSLSFLPGTFWQQWASSPQPSSVSTALFQSLPVVLTVGLRDQARCQQFMQAVQKASSRYKHFSVWTTHSFQEYTYVKIAPHPASQGRKHQTRLTIYYAITPQHMLITLSLAALKVSLQRLSRQSQQASSRPTTQMKTRATSRRVVSRIVQDNQPLHWPGKHVRLTLTRQLLQWIWMAYRDTILHHQQKRSWANLPILNEWKRRFPDKDPVAFHRQQTQRFLRCPGGGVYRWNAEWNTMESSVFGHPMQPKSPYLAASWTQQIQTILTGFTFEMQGLRSHVVLELAP